MWGKNISFPDGSPFNLINGRHANPFDHAGDYHAIFRPNLPAITCSCTKREALSTCLSLTMSTLPTKTLLCLQALANIKRRISFQRQINAMICRLDSCPIGQVKEKMQCTMPMVMNGRNLYEGTACEEKGKKRETRENPYLSR